jgi:hypothetical protein
MNEALAAEDRVPAGRPAVPLPLAVALTALSAIALLAANAMPWVRLRVTPGVLAGLAGDVAPRDLGAYGLTQLAPAGTPLSLRLGWCALFGLFAVALARAAWRRRLLGVAALVAAFLVITTLTIGQAAAKISGHAGEYPETTLLGGALLAVLGTFLVLAAIGVLALPARVGTTPRAVAHPAGSGPVEAFEPAPVVAPPAPATPASTGPMTVGPAQTPPARTLHSGTPASSFSWSARPADTPGRRRRRVVIAAIGGATAVAVTSALIVWLAVGQPRPPSKDAKDLRQLLPSTPADAEPLVLPWAPDGQLSTARLPEVTGRPAVTNILSQNGFRSGAVRGWREPGGAVVIVELMRFDRPERADQLRLAVLFAESEKLGGSGTRDIPDVRGAVTFAVAGQEGSAAAASGAVGSRGNVLFVIIRQTPGPSDSAAVEALARDEYRRL